MTEVNIAQDYGAMLLGSFLSFGCVASLDQKSDPFDKVLAACLVALTCNSSCTGDCTLVSVGVLSHWYGDLPSSIHFLIGYTGYCNMVRFECSFVCEIVNEVQVA